MLVVKRKRIAILRLILIPAMLLLGVLAVRAVLSKPMASSIAIGSASVIEGDGSGTVNLDFTVSLSPANPTQTVTVDFRTSTTGENISTFGGLFAATASPDPGADYNSQTGTLIFDPGDTSKTISVQVNKDCLPERDEFLRVILSNPVNASLSNTAGQGGITTDDNRSISISDTSVVEGDGSGTVSLDFTVSLGGSPVTAASVAACGPVTVDFRTSTTGENISTFGGLFAATASPDPGADYNSQTGTVTFNAGDTTKTISVLVNKDCLVERDESLRVFISNPVNGTLNNSSGQGTITTDDNRSISISDASVIEGDGSGTVSLDFTVSLGGSPLTAASVAGCGPVTVDFRTSTTAENISAFGGLFAATASPDPGADYNSQTGTVTFNAGDTSKTVSILVNKDCLAERDESLRVFLSNAVNATLSNTLANGTITTDDNRSISITGGTITEGAGVNVNLDFTVSLSGSPVTASGVAACGPVTVDFRTSTTAENVSQFGGQFAATASPDPNSDYISQNGTLTFNPGETTKIISVVVTADCLPELTESLSVRLSNPVNATLSNNNDTGIILNNTSGCLAVTNTNDSGDGSLRQAIGNANINGDLSVISFNLPGSGPFTISPTSPLPVITNPIVIDGYTQPGSAANTDPQGDNAVLLIELDGSNSGGSASGLIVNGPSNCVIRGLVINRFAQSGIQLLTAANASVEGNFIGTDTTGTQSRGNGQNGVVLQSTSNAVIGGATNASRNIVAFNALAGVFVSSGAANQIRRNNIFGNTGLGIDLAPTGVTPNDSCDGDGGSNSLQNSPVLTAAIRSGASTVVTGTLNSTASSTFTLEFFANPTCHPSGSGDGRSFLGSALVTTDASCMANINVALPGLVPLGTIITATATDAAGNTSEFSACSTPTAVEIADLSAKAYDSGVLVQWQTGFEVDNLGFNIYRDLSGKRTLVNPSLIAGSALRVGPHVTLRSGQSYAWWDSSADSKSGSYWIEALDLNGQTRWYGPVGVQPAQLAERGSEKAVEQSRLLTSLSGSRFDSTPLERRTSVKSGTAKAGLSQLGIASGPAVKVSVKHEGWYRVSQPELIAAGLNPSADPRVLQFFVDGNQVPISVIGGADGRLDPSDSIEFYGLGLDSPFSDQHIYWLVAGRDPGLRITTIQSQEPSLSSGNFAQTLERRDRSIYFPALLNGETENFFGALIASQPVNQTLTVRHRDISASEPAVVEVALQGVSAQLHQVRVSLNGIDLGAISFDGKARGVSRFSVPSQSILEGDNQVLLTASGAQDSSLVDYIRLTYEHAFIADDDALRFTASGQQQITINGFSQPDIRVFDVTDPMFVQELIGSIEKSKTGCSVSLRLAGSGPRELLALTSSRTKSSDRTVSNAVSNLRSPAHGADLIVITHTDFAGGLQPLVSARLKQGFSVSVVDVEDIYDEFSFGNKTPYAIRDFLSYAKTSWKKKPRYVLLAGCASYDPKNFLGAGDIDFVPTKLVDTSLMETSSDDWLVDFNQDGMPDLAIGRLPFRSAAEAAYVTGRIVGYDQAQPSEQTLLVADKNEGFNFESVNDQLAPLVNGNARVIDIRRGQMSDPEAKSRLIEAINRGQKIVNYAGHGSVDLWHSSLFTSADVTQLTNPDQLSVFVMMNCLNGYFDDPLLESLGAALLNAPQGGAVAVWASSAMTTPESQALMNRELYRQLFGSLRMTLGDAVKNAKAAIPDGDVRRSWILLGDPTMRLR